MQVHFEPTLRWVFFRGSGLGLIKLSMVYLYK